MERLSWVIFLLLINAAGAAPSLHWLKSGALPTETFLSPFPSPQSKAQSKDITEVLALQSTRSSSDCRRANSEVHITLETFFGRPYGPLSPVEVKRYAAFFDKVTDDTDYFVVVMKKYWQRPRPYASDDRVKPCLPRNRSLSYPSGHAAIARAIADLLGEIDPDRRELFLQRSDQIARDRELGGVHYGTDLAAGQRLADRVVEELHRNTAFEREFSRLKATARGGATP